MTIKRFLVIVNRVTAYHRHGNIIPKTALDDLCNAQLEFETKLQSSNSDYAKCKSIGCQFYDEKMEFNCGANEVLCEKCMNSQHFT